MPVPALRAVQPHINFIGGSNKHFRKAGTAAGAEYDSGLSKVAVNLFVPPARVPELHRIAARRIELTYNGGEAGLSVVVAWRELEEKAPHLLAEDISDHAEIPNERFSAFEPFYVGDELAHLDRVNEAFGTGLSPPSLDICNGRP